MRIGLIGVALATMLVSGPALAAQPAITDPDWRERPDAEAFARHFPEVPQFLSIEGRVTIRCTVDVDGQLYACASVSVEPAGLGFEQSAVALGSHFRMAPRDLSGQAVVGREVRIPLRFALPKAQAASPPASLPSRRAPPQDALVAAREALRLSGEVDRLESQLDRNWRAAMARSRETTDLPTVVRAAEARGRALPKISSDLAEGMAVAYAQRLSAAEIRSWIVYLKSPTFKTMQFKQSALSTAFFNARVGRAQRAQVRMREAFCRPRDCKIAPPITESRTLLERQPPTITAPTWSRAPSRGEIWGAYPRIARTFGIDGLVILRCGVGAGGSLEGCDPLIASPKGLGFGDAALTVAARFALPTSQSGPSESVLAPVIFASSPGRPVAEPKAMPPADLTLALAVAEAYDTGRESTDYTINLTESAILQETPGVGMATQREAAEIFRETMVAETPSLLRDYAETYAAHLDPVDLRTLLNFYRSPAGCLVNGGDRTFNTEMIDIRRASSTAEIDALRAGICDVQVCPSQ